jgi:hypothetical protein
MVDRVPGPGCRQPRAARANARSDRDERAHADTTSDHHTYKPDGDSNGNRDAHIHPSTYRRVVVGGRF